MSSSSIRSVKVLLLGSDGNDPSISFSQVNEALQKPITSQGMSGLGSVKLVGSASSFSANSSSNSVYRISQLTEYKIGALEIPSEEIGSSDRVILWLLAY